MLQSSTEKKNNYARVQHTVVFLTLFTTHWYVRFPSCQKGFCKRIPSPWIVSCFCRFPDVANALENASFKNIWEGRSDTVFGEILPWFHTPFFAEMSTNRELLSESLASNSFGFFLFDNLFYRVLWRMLNLPLAFSCWAPPISPYYGFWWAPFLHQPSSPFLFWASFSSWNSGPFVRDVLTGSGGQPPA